MLLLQPGPGPWTQILKNLDSKNLDPKKVGPRKIWALKNLGHEKRGKQLDVEQRLEDHIA